MSRLKPDIATRIRRRRNRAVAAFANAIPHRPLLRVVWGSCAGTARLFYDLSRLALASADWALRKLIPVALLRALLDAAVSALRALARVARWLLHAWVELVEHLYAAVVRLGEVVGRLLYELASGLATLIEWTVDATTALKDLLKLAIDAETRLVRRLDRWAEDAISRMRATG
jgi:hypothetical protein